MQIMRHIDLVSGKLVVYWLMDPDTISQSSQILQVKENSPFYFCLFQPLLHGNLFA